MATPTPTSMCRQHEHNLTENGSRLQASVTIALTHMTLSSTASCRETLAPNDDIDLRMVYNNKDALLSQTW